MKTTNKILSSLLSLVLIVTVFSVMAVPAQASSTGEDPDQIWAFYDDSFSSAWELYHAGDSGQASLTYGYNTFLIHEDYSWANHSTKTHKGVIATANGTYNGPNNPAGSVSKIEIMHLAFEIFYFCTY